MVLKEDESYLWLLPVFACLLFAGTGLGGAMGDVRLGVIVMPLFQAFLLYSQIHSDVALDAWWRAIYRRDHPDYRARIRWNAIALAWLIIFSGLVIGIGGPIPAQ